MTLFGKKNTATRDGEKCAAALSLKRRGIHPTRRCHALAKLKHCVLKWSHRVYHGLFNYDTMHVLFINCIGYLLDATLNLLTKTKKIELDRRARALPSFRNPYTGKTTRKVSKWHIFTSCHYCVCVCYTVTSYLYGISSCHVY